MWRRTFGVPVPPAWPVAGVFTLALTLAAARAEDPRLLTPGVCLGLLAGLAAVGSCNTRRATAAAIAGTAWLFDNGFVAHSGGDLRWRTASDLPVLALLVGCALLSASLTAGRRPAARPTPPSQHLETTHG